MSKCINTCTECLGGLGFNNIPISISLYNKNVLNFGGTRQHGYFSTHLVKVTPFLVDGKWSVWSGWSTCSVTCALGKLTRSRTCTDPQYGGEPCIGSSSENKSCYVGNCPGLYLIQKYLFWNGYMSCWEIKSSFNLKRLRIQKGIYYTGSANAIKGHPYHTLYFIPKVV